MTAISRDDAMSVGATTGQVLRETGRLLGLPAPEYDQMLTDHQAARLRALPITGALGPAEARALFAFTLRWCLARLEAQR